MSAEPIPYREAAIDILRRLALVLYPGYFVKARLDQNNLEYYLGQQITSLYEMLSKKSSPLLVLYPGYFIKTRLDQNNLQYYLGQQITSLHEMLSTDYSGYTA